MKNNNYIPNDFSERSNFIQNVLYDIMTSLYKEQLIFKGGTMLSLFLGSNRFSEDIDLDVKDGYDKKEVAEYIYNYLGEKGYQLGKLHLDWTNVYNIEVLYSVNNTSYTCQVEIFKDSFGITPLYTQEIFIGQPINIMSLEQSFAHKICAYIERGSKSIPKSGRPKGRDLYDIHYFIINNTDIDLSIIKKRLGINSLHTLFLFIYKQIAITHYNKLNDFIYEINNFHYGNRDQSYIIKELLEIINDRYLDNEISYNFHIWKDLNDLNGGKNVIIDEKYICRKENDLYFIYDIHTFKSIYDTKDENKLRQKVKNMIETRFFFLTFPKIL